VAGRKIERFYHFICKGDQDLLDLVAELDLEEQLHWQLSNTSFYYHGRSYGFGSPIDLLRFSPVPWLQRIRFGWNVIDSRFRRQWQRLDDVAARSWLIDRIGQKAYDVIWDPLLRVKFGEYHDQVSAAWIWHRIHRVASSRRRFWEKDYFGYLEGGSETVIEGLLNRLRRMPNVEIRTGAAVERILSEGGRVSGVLLKGENQPMACRDLVSTIALPALLKLAPDLPDDYRSKLSQIEYLGVVCGLVKVRQPLTQSFWVNINDPSIPFNGVIEYSNLNKHLGMGNSAIVYVPYYLHRAVPRFHFSDDQLVAEFVAGFKRISPEFDESWIEEVHVSRASHAQAICSIGFSKLVPKHEAPLEGLYITDSTQYYPEDRTISAAIRLGRRVATMIDANREDGGMGDTLSREIPAYERS